jgi:hypothetical protein
MTHGIQPQMTVHNKLPYIVATVSIAFNATVYTQVSEPPVEDRPVLSEHPVPQWAWGFDEKFSATDAVWLHSRISQESSDYAVSLVYLMVRLFVVSFDNSDALHETEKELQTVWNSLPIESRMGAFVTSEYAQCLWDKDVLPVGPLKDHIRKYILNLALETFAELDNKLASLGENRPVRLMDVNPDLMVSPGTNPDSIKDRARREAYIDALSRIPRNIHHNKLLQSYQDIQRLAKVTLIGYFEHYLDMNSEKDRQLFVEAVQNSEIHDQSWIDEWAAKFIPNQSPSP